MICALYVLGILGVCLLVSWRRAARLVRAWYRGAGQRRASHGRLLILAGPGAVGPRRARLGRARLGWLLHSIAATRGGAWRRVGPARQRKARHGRLLTLAQGAAWLRKGWLGEAVPGSARRGWILSDRPGHPVVGHGDPRLGKARHGRLLLDRGDARHAAARRGAAWRGGAPHRAARLGRSLIFGWAMPGYARPGLARRVKAWMSYFRYAARHRRPRQVLAGLRSPRHGRLHSRSKHSNRERTVR